MLVYFDIETFSGDGFRSGGTKVIAIHYRDFNGRVRMLKEWESSEKEILQSFLTDMKMIKRDDFLMLVGHNVLRFDIPTVIRRMAANGIDSSDSLQDFFGGVFVVDTMQCMLPFNSMRFKGLNIDDVSGGLGISGPHRRNTEVESFYRERKFAEIERHAAADLDFVQDLYWKLKRGEVPKNFGAGTSGAKLTETRHAASPSNGRRFGQRHARHN